MFSRNTIVDVTSILDRNSHSEIERICLRFGIENVAPKQIGSIATRVNAICKYLINNQDQFGPNGGNLVLEFFEFVIETTEARWTNWIKDYAPKALKSLEKDGYRIIDSRLISILPTEIIQLPEKENELFSLLERYNLHVPKGHLEQAVDSHGKNNWAAANSQLRTYVESLFDEITEFFEPGISKIRKTSHERREYLAKMDPPFFDQKLHEWELGKTGGFVQGFWKRLHPDGSHPGLSDENDCTFRLHLVLLVTHFFLKRLSER